MCLYCLGYNNNKYKGYRCLSHDECIYISRHVIFDESLFPYATCFSNALELHTSKLVSQPSMLYLQVTKWFNGGQQLTPSSFGSVSLQDSPSQNTTSN